MISTAPSFLVLLAAVALLLFPSPTDAVRVRFGLSGASCDGTNIKARNIEVNCNGSSDCNGGETAVITGTLKIGSDINGDEKVMLTPCITAMGISLRCLGSEESGSLCEWYDYSSAGAECGEAGTYNLYKAIDIPQEANEINFYGFPVTIKASVGDDECQTQAEAGEMSMAYVGVGGAVALVGAYALFQQQRRRRIITDGDDDKARAFVEMADACSPTV